MLCVPFTSAAQKKNSKRSLSVGCPLHSKLEDEQKFADFVIRIYRGADFDGCVQVLRDNHVVFSKNADGIFIIGNDVNRDSKDEVFHPPAIPLGTDITGLGKPNLILIEFSGGAHCCFTFHVVELGSSPQEIASIEAEHSDYAHFEDLNHDGTYEFVGWDYTFAYWHTGFLQSPAPRIVLRFNGKHYELAPDMMRDKPPSPEQLTKVEAEIRDGEWNGGNPPPQLWGTMLDLIYAGNSDLAWKFLDAAWAPGYKGKARFLQDFCTTLAASPYFPRLRPTIPTAPCSLHPQRKVTPVEHRKGEARS